MAIFYMPPRLPHGIFFSRIFIRHGSTKYEPPTGNLWNVAPGKKYEPEGWEFMWKWGMMGGLVLGTVIAMYRPDTRIQTWALEEARKELEEEGILERRK
ncbi:hypothetical protein NEOLI_004209 [Neolecta irregularis DAH-3]|uniref:NADH dehydrogenase [ubiquinone] 1 beta subcomplex subunit 11, mitochondrial n=1 Tax=Neolecta irregularis (strain DAH-3) TaxID=1198029 RepID=A0A1U7LGM7_NEOID|nr:hypothetical protein NEOLI_004209 [Neolecta irregularis DAH-3]|eukprot:OLL21799.1 hypothetical protein NEOLI_004209 [Neolecta irregularis DAH-3]